MKKLIHVHEWSGGWRAICDCGESAGGGDRDLAIGVAKRHAAAHPKGEVSKIVLEEGDREPKVLWEHGRDAYPPKI